jgi:hypothetical protein
MGPLYYIKHLKINKNVHPLYQLGLHFVNPCIGKFMGLTSLQMQKNFCRKCFMYKVLQQIKIEDYKGMEFNN